MVRIISVSYVYFGPVLLASIAPAKYRNCVCAHVYGICLCARVCGCMPHVHSCRGQRGTSSALFCHCLTAFRLGLTPNLELSRFSVWAFSCTPVCPANPRNPPVCLPC